MAGASSLAPLIKAKLWEGMQDSDIWWVLLGIQANEGGKEGLVFISAIGDTPVADMLKHVQDDQIYFGM